MSAVESAFKKYMDALERAKKFFPIHLIAVGHRSGVGKDTFAELAQEHYRDIKIVKLSFASEIYSLMYLIQSELGREPKKEREWLIAIGETARKLYGADFWVERLIVKTTAAIEARLDRGDDCGDESAPLVIVVTDLRRENERQWLAKMGFWLVKINRPGVIADDAARGDKNEDELAAAEFHYEIDNSGSLADYRDAVKKMFLEKSKKL